MKTALTFTILHKIPQYNLGKLFEVGISYFKFKLLKLNTTKEDILRNSTSFFTCRFENRYYLRFKNVKGVSKMVLLQNMRAVIGAYKV